MEVSKFLWQFFAIGLIFAIVVKDAGKFLLNDSHETLMNLSAEMVNIHSMYLSMPFRIFFQKAAFAHVNTRQYQSNVISHKLSK